MGYVKGYANGLTAGSGLRVLKGFGMRKGFLSGVIGVAFLFGVSVWGVSPAFGAVVSLGEMASLSARGWAFAHKVSFTFVPAEQGAGQRSSRDSSGENREDSDDSDESEDIVSSSEPRAADSGPVIVGTTPGYQSESADRREVMSHIDSSRSARNRSYPALTVTDEPAQSMASPSGARVRNPRPALTLMDENMPSDGASSGIRPHRPDSLPEGAIGSNGYAPSAKPALTTMAGQPWSVDGSPSSVRPHRPDLLVYGEAAVAQKALASSSLSSPPPPSEGYAKALSAEILAKQEAPAPILSPSSAIVPSPKVVPAVQPASTVSPSFVPMPDISSPATMAVAQASAIPMPVVQPEAVSASQSSGARASGPDTFGERAVVARSERALAAQASVANDSVRAVEPASASQVSSVTFPSAPAVVVARPVSRGVVPDTRPQAVSAVLRSASYSTGGVIKASMVVPAAAASAPVAQGRQIVSPSAQVTQVQAVQPPAPLTVQSSSVAMAPQNPANRGGSNASKVYEITDVAVDVKADSAAHARDQALAKAQKIAFGQLLERLGSDAAAADAIGADMLASLTQSFEVQNERASSSRYIGMFTIQFKPSAVRAWLGQTKGAYSEERSGPMVVLPVYVNNGRPVLWEERTRWRAAWESSVSDSGLVPVIVPDGELDDMAVVSTEEAVSGKPDSLKALAVKYHAVGTAVVVLKGAFDNSATGFSVQMQRVDAMGNQAPLETIPLPAPEVGRSGSDAMLALSVKKVRQQMEADWRRERSLASTGVTMASVQAVGVGGVASDDYASQGVMVRLRALVPVSSGAALEGLRQRMTDVPGLPRVDVLSLQSGSARVELGISSSIEDVQAALMERDIELRQDPIGGGWSLRALQ